MKNHNNDPFSYSQLIQHLIHAIAAKTLVERGYIYQPNTVKGNKREEISPKLAYSCYRQRFDIEHMLRFGKQRLLMTQFQTPDVEHEENWIQFVLLAYVQLWAAKDLAEHLPKPWERYLKQNNDKIVTPSVVQRDFQRIISEIGTPARPPKTVRKFNWSGSRSGN